MRADAVHAPPPGDPVCVAGVREAGSFPDPETAIDAAGWQITTLHTRLGPASTSQLTL